MFNAGALLSGLTHYSSTEYMEKHTVSRLLGAPPGTWTWIFVAKWTLMLTLRCHCPNRLRGIRWYVDWMLTAYLSAAFAHPVLPEGGQLTDAVRRKPYSVLLFDEMEKAHPDVFNVMLQMLDDGRLTDSKGNTCNFRNTICIFTSNIGSSDILDLGGSSEIGDQAVMKTRVTEAMKAHFKPEFLNRIDEYVIFNSLSKTDLREIVKLETKRLENRLGEREIRLALSEAALDFLADVGFDPVYGARPLKRTIQRELETVVARGILSGDFADGDTIVVDVSNERLDVRKAIDAAASSAEPIPLEGAFD